MTYGNEDFVPVVLGTGLNAYNIARCLHEAYGVRTLALGRVTLRETQHSSIISVRATRGFDDAETIVRTLEELAAEFAHAATGVRPKLLLIPTIEFYTNVVINHRERLEPHYLIPLVGRELADRLINKTDFYATCKALGIPHPITTVLTPAHRGDPGIGEALGFEYPVILKPSNTDIYPRLHFEGKQKIYLVPDASALRSVVEMIFAAGYDDDLIVQQYIPGDETVMRVANTYSDKHGALASVSIGQVVLADQSPDRVGNYNAILTVRDDELTASLTTLLEAIGYSGMANFDVMYDRRDNTSKLLEINLRLGGASFYAMAAGGNISQRIVQDMVYGEGPALHVTTEERLWLNLPYPLALMYAPRDLRSRVRKAARKGSAHTLWYRADKAPKRIINVLRVDLRYALSTVKFARRGMNR